MSSCDVAFYHGGDTPQWFSLNGYGIFWEGDVITLPAGHHMMEWQDLTTEDVVVVCDTPRTAHSPAKGHVKITGSLVPPATDMAAPPVMEPITFSPVALVLILVLAAGWIAMIRGAR